MKYGFGDGGKKIWVMYSIHHLKNAVVIHIIFYRIFLSLFKYYYFTTSTITKCN